MKAFTDRALRSLQPRARRFELADRGPGSVRGLCLRVLPEGVKVWTFRYRIPGGRQRRLTIGPFPAVGLADARELAMGRLLEVRKGADPVQDRRDADRVKLHTFGALADLYIKQHAKPRKRSWREDERKLEKDLPRSWRNRPAKEISRRDIREAIERKAERYPIQANRLRALLHRLFAFAVEREIVDFNPVTGTPRPGVERRRERYLDDDEIRAFWAATEAMAAPMRAFWRLRLVTGQRAGEVNTMTWGDLDLAGGWWTIPPDHSKNGRAHRVPLSALALGIIGELAHLRDEEDEAGARPGRPTGLRNGYVLEGARGKRQQAEAGASLGLEDFVGHDLRKTAGTLMVSAGIPLEHVSRVLNHSLQGVTARHYVHHSYDPEKRVALDTWARKLRSILDPTTGANVVSISRKA
jgi:integrase